MQRIALLAILAATSSGCATTAAIVRPHVTLPVLIGATVADLAVVAVLTAQIKDFTVGAVIATTLAATAADVGVSCILGGCSVLRP